MNPSSASHLNAPAAPGRPTVERSAPPAAEGRLARRFAELLKEQKKARAGDPDQIDATVPVEAFARAVERDDPPVIAAAGFELAVEPSARAHVAMAGEPFGGAAATTAVVMSLPAGPTAGAVRQIGVDAVVGTSAAEAQMSNAQNDFEMLARSLAQPARAGDTHEMRVLFRSTMLAGALAHVTSSPTLVNVLIAAPLNARQWLQQNQRQLSEELGRRLGRHVVLRIENISATAEAAR